MQELRIFFCVLGKVVLSFSTAPCILEKKFPSSSQTGRKTVYLENGIYENKWSVQWICYERHEECRCWQFESPIVSITSSFVLSQRSARVTICKSIRCFTLSWSGGTDKRFFQFAREAACSSVKNISIRSCMKKVQNEVKQTLES